MATRPPLAAAAPAVALNWVPIRLHAARYLDVHGDELAAVEPETTMPFSVALEGVALAAMGGAKPSVETTMAPFGWDLRSSFLRETHK